MNGRIILIILLIISFIGEVLHYIEHSKINQVHSIKIAIFLSALILLDAIEKKKNK